MNLSIYIFKLNSLIELHIIILVWTNSFHKFGQTIHLSIVLLSGSVAASSGVTLPTLNDIRNKLKFVDYIIYDQLILPKILVVANMSYSRSHCIPCKRSQCFSYNKFSITLKWTVHVVRICLLRKFTIFRLHNSTQTIIYNLISICICKFKRKNLLIWMLIKNCIYDEII